MSALGQKLTFAMQNGMSAKGLNDLMDRVLRRCKCQKQAERPEAS